MARFDIILPTYGKPNIVMLCIQSILEHSADYRMLWIDNDPNWLAGRALPSHYVSLIHYLPQEENIGYTKAINAGLALSTAPYVVLLNSDTEIMTDGWLEKLAAPMETDPKLAAVGPVTTNKRQGLAGMLAPNTGVHYMQAEIGPNGLLGVKLWFWCIMLRREAIVDVGYMDERFSPGGGEDDDWLTRAWLLDWRTAIQTDVTVKHIGQASWPELESLEVRSERAHRVYREKWAGKLPPISSTAGLELVPASTSGTTLDISWRT